MIPIIIICHNNYKYVENTIKQIKNINIEYYNNIFILDNKSTDKNTIDFLRNCKCKVIYNNKNESPRISEINNVDIYNLLPDKFIITDPDLEFNKNLPNNFIEIINELSDMYNVNKIGFALDIFDYDKMFDYTNYVGTNIHNWESRFWYQKINNSQYDLFLADIDTTFCLINKKGRKELNIRIAGNFMAKHLPWYIENKLFTHYEIYTHYCKMNPEISTIVNVMIPYYEKTFNKIVKNEQIILIKKNDDNIIFWDNYVNWNCELFINLDKYLSKDKIYIDIGDYIGETAIYASHKSKKVYVIKDNNNDDNYKINSTNIEIINIDNIDNLINNIDINNISLIKINRFDFIINKILNLINNNMVNIYINKYII